MTRPVVANDSLPKHNDPIRVRAPGIVVDAPAVGRLREFLVVDQNQDRLQARLEAARQDRFLKLLVAQLNSQDPMNPMDNAQMTSQIAQLNTVTGIEDLNKTVGSVLSQMSSMQALQGATMVGHDVLVPGSKLSVADGVATGVFDLAVPADNVTVEIRTA